MSQASGALLKRNQSRAMRVILDSRNFKLSTLLSNTHASVEPSSAIPETVAGSVASFERLSSQLLKVVLGRLTSTRRASSVAYDDFTVVESDADSALGVQSATEVESVMLPCESVVDCCTCLVA